MRKLELNYRIEGEGYPVVFLHGFLASNHIWENIIPQLKGIRALQIELPGHGASPLFEEPPSIQLIAEAVNYIIEKECLQNFALVGHSMGGYVALEIAKNYSSKIEAFVLLNSHPWADSEQKKKDRKRVVKIVNYDKRLFINEAITDLYHDKLKYETAINKAIDVALQMSEKAISDALLAMANREDATEVTYVLGNKLHCVYGEFDTLIDGKKLQELTQLTKNYFHFIKNIGHCTYDESPREFIQLLTHLLPLGRYN